MYIEENDAMSPGPDKNGTRQHHHDTHAIPPQDVCDVFKKYQQMSDAQVDGDSSVVDFSRGLSSGQTEKVRCIETVPTWQIKAASRDFLDGVNLAARPCDVFGHLDFPGLKMFPGLLTPEVQIALLDQLLHHELSIASHKTNLHDDYNLPYPGASFFSLPQSSPEHILIPKSEQKPLNIAQFLRKKWRWLTFGAQYDWSTRRYPAKEDALQFSPKIARLVAGFFPQIRAESGVVLVYSPKDFMPVHRDVSELAERDLASITLGLDGLFVVALHDKKLVIRVRSGDVVQMSGETRWSWHAMPKVMAGTCPDFLRDWPVKEGMDPKDETNKAYEKWRGYMERKRVNLSCRQVYD